MESLQKLLLLSILAGVAAAANPNWGCPQQCHCRWVAGKKTTDCSYGGHTSLSTLLLDGATEVQVLNLTGNTLTQIARYSFSDIFQLQKLMLRDCKLVSIDKLGLKSLELLYYLDLSKNLLTTLHNETFRGLSALVFVSLVDNQLQKLEDGLFSNLPRLQRVDLSRNKIVEISANTFMNAPKLRTLQLNNNRLEYLNVDILKALTSLSILELNDNPWRCDCKLQPLTNWLISQRWVNESQIACAEPAGLRGKTWKDLDANNFACPPDIVDIANTTVRAITSEPIETSNTNHTLTCQVNGNPLSALHWTPNSQWEVKYYVCGDYLCMAKMVEERVFKLSKDTIPSAV